MRGSVDCKKDSFLIYLGCRSWACAVRGALRGGGNRRMSQRLRRGQIVGGEWGSRCYFTALQ